MGLALVVGAVVPVLAMALAGFVFTGVANAMQSLAIRGAPVLLRRTSVR
jgi:hypothetical protein